MGNSITSRRNKVRHMPQLHESATAGSSSAGSSVISAISIHRGTPKEEIPKFEDFWTYNETIANGNFGVVKYCNRKSDNLKCICKNINKQRMIEDRKQEWNALTTEIRMLVQLNHRNIVTCLDVFENKKSAQIVFEICDGGDLNDVLAATPNGYLSEAICSQITASLACALEYMHDRGVVHRNICPANILFKITNGGMIPKLADFEKAHYDPTTQSPWHHIMRSTVGNKFYVAWEVLYLVEYNNICDYWSLGATLYQMLCGHIPFETGSIHEMYAKIKRADLDFTPFWDTISADAKSCVTGLVDLDLQTRMRWKELQLHPFIINIDPSAASGIDICTPTPDSAIDDCNNDEMKSMESDDNSNETKSSVTTSVITDTEWDASRQP